MNRRSFLCAAPVAGAVIAAPALALAASSQAMTLEELCEYHAAKLCEAMQKLHGGHWDSFLDHKVRCGLIRQR
ncbi:hypothetical protein [Pseudochrobactrum asaccharolyticum]|uniref:Secreted protein n=1 Tax=Pseudochrobactrum asaccharolyticum TaxID=354351 RepID=A0A366DK92_9HYPH|nr:hypothetical protein [Pseudochrobactrum asaccharolyticum]RBO89668.1 hypothetical protein DFR47_11535 [Pseudochrobactrum asaccharolyticum]